MVKRKLIIEIEYDFVCVGLSCKHKNYRLAWHLNNSLDTQLKKTEHIRIIEPMFNEEMLFSRFEFADENQDFAYTLVGNRNKWGFLIPEQSNFDYFLLLSGNRLNEKEIIEHIKSIKIVLSSTKLELNTLKHKERFLL